MCIYAREAIPAGDPILHCYTPVLNPTNIRRLMLFTGKHFSCECARCKDPTEMDSFSSALLCGDCGQNDKAPVLPENPIDLISTWKCVKCGGNEMTGSDVAMLERRVSLEVSELDQTDIQSMEALLSRNSGILHPRNALLVKVKQMLSVGYGRFDGDLLHSLSESKLQRKLELCMEVYDAMHILETGIGARRGRYCLLT